MKRILSLVLTAVFLFSLAASPAFAADTKKMKIAFCTWAGYAPLLHRKKVILPSRATM